MQKEPTPHPERLPGEIAGRYRVEGTLGRGGNAVVYHVVDASTGRQLALKQLLFVADSEVGGAIAELFEHEFHTLSQLAHPRVIEVYDFGLDESGPYYTMELLDGGDLRELSPLPWQRVCAHLRDISSSLSLLHSRRLVHRDLTPRNVRCTRDGRAKLIDFGAMMPMGPCKHLIGTPAFTAPEMVNLQALDARVDLYSLGTTAYYALTGRHAYPARTFAELRDVWRSRPPRPSRFAEDIPKELDALVLALISLDPLARPANAAEVMERIDALVEPEGDERLLVARAYLSTPTLVGREEQLLRVRWQIVGATQGRGGSLMVQGAAGVGRSRLLDACVLEGKLAGATVLRADASDASQGKWGAVRTMARQLLDALPEVALEAARPYLSVLGHLLPELVDRFVAHARQGLLPPPTGQLLEALGGDDPGRDRAGGSEPEQPAPSAWAQLWGMGFSSRPPPPASDHPIVLERFDDPGQLRPRLQEALSDWLLDIGSKRCVLLAVDDLHRVDEPSAAFLALLAHEVFGSKLLVIATCETEASATAPGALKLLSKTGSALDLRDLSGHQIEALLGSIFGEVHHLKPLAARLDALSGGNPRGVMQLARYLVDSGAIRYRAGAWSLPERVEAADLPESLAEAFKARIDQLGAEARALAETMALSPGHGYGFDQCLSLLEGRNMARLVRSLDELQAAGVLATDNQSYAFSQTDWVAALVEAMDEKRRRTLHLRLAEMFEQEPSQHFRVTTHLLQAGEPERALGMLLQEIDATRERMQQSGEAQYEYLQSLPGGWTQTYESLLEFCRRTGQPERDRFKLLRTLVELSVAEDTTDRERLLEVADRFVHLSGLAIYHELGDSVQPSERLGQALQLAQQRFDQSAESERVMAPGDAIRALAQTLVLIIKQAGTTWDHALIASAPSLEPLLPLSPALGVVEKNVQSTAHMLAARSELARDGYLEIVERLEQPDRAGLDDTVFTYVRLSVMYAIAGIEASQGVATALDWADKIEVDPRFRVNAMRVRMVYALRQGDAAGAEEYRKRIELLKIQNTPIQYFEGAHVFTELLAHAAADDLLRIKQIIAEVEKQTQRSESFRPFLHLAVAEYNRIRGDFLGAVVESERALELTAAGTHQAWARAAAAKVAGLFGLGRCHEAVRCGRDYLRQAEAERLGSACHAIRISLALAEAAAGEGESAVADVETAIAAYRRAGMTGLYLGNAHEARARVALLLDDREAFSTHARLCAEQYRAGDNPALTAKHEKLMQEARRTLPGFIGEGLGELGAISKEESELVGLVTTVLTACQGPRERARRALDIILKQSASAGGFLYTRQRSGPALCAEAGHRARPVDLDLRVAERLSAELDLEEGMTATSSITRTAIPAETWQGPAGERFRPLLLGHPTEDGFCITGLAIVALEDNRPFEVPIHLLAAVSRSLFDAGDVATAKADD